MRRVILDLRATEGLVESMRSGSKPAGQHKAAVASTNAAFADLEKRLQQHIGTRVRLSGKASAGKLEIHYFSADDLERILKVIRLPSA